MGPTHYFSHSTASVDVLLMGDDTNRTGGATMRNLASQIKPFDVYTRTVTCMNALCLIVQLVLHRFVPLIQ